MSSRFQDVRSALREDLPPWGVLVFESHHASEFQMAWRTHGFAKIVYVLDGAGSFDIEADVIEFSTGDVIVVPPGVRNRIRDCEGQPVSLYAACVAESVIDCVPGLGERFRTMVWTQDHRHTTRSMEMLADAWRLIGLIVDEILGDRRMGSYSIGNDLTGNNLIGNDLIGNDLASDKPLRTAQISDREIVEQYVDELKTNFLDAQSIDQAAEACGLSRRAFTHRFREVTGTSWLAHVRQLAINHASTLLRDSDLPIVSVAFEAGFADLSTFYRQFTKRVGLSPATYRDASRKP